MNVGVDCSQLTRNKLDEFAALISSLNTNYGLELPEKKIDWSPQAWKDDDSRTGLSWRSLRDLRYLFFRNKDSVDRAVEDFSEWVAAETFAVPRRQNGPGPARGSLRHRTRQCSEEPLLSENDKNERLEYLERRVCEELYLLENNYSPTRNPDTTPPAEKNRIALPKRRRLSEDDDEDDEFHTAPNSPTKTNGHISQAMPPPLLDQSFRHTDLDAHDQQDTDRTKPMSFLEKLTQERPKPDSQSRVDTSFATSLATSIDSVFSANGGHAEQSFETDVTDTQSTYADSIFGWVEKHSKRQGKPIPEKPSRRAWDAAHGDFKTDRHSEVVVFTGELNWISFDEGLFDLKLNPPKAEKTYEPGDRSSSRKSRKKSKTKEVPRFRIEFFAVDGRDFCPKDPFSSLVAPPRQQSDKHTAMTLHDLLEWHMPKSHNANQSKCKLFQRLSLGLSKTFASITLKPTQVLHKKDDPRWVRVMHDGCAPMSRALAQKICQTLGITGNGSKFIPSAFQGRIAGAKGLWMVDRSTSKYQSFSENDGDDIWLEISDSQLKIFPHPQEWSGIIDDEKLTFEVVSWSKPLHPVELNIQLLVILDHGGNVKRYIAELAKRGLDKLAEDLENVLASDNNILCLGLMQKLKPSGEATNKSRQLGSWVLNDGEFVNRLCQAGLTPQSFYPLRNRLQKLFKWTIEHQVEELHIQVPLSSYAYCIADPYGVLEEDEVHFAFSSNWQDPDGNFQYSELMETDVLVGRLPAHVPSDIQRRRAVYKSELRYFKDVIVFSTKGDMPLAHMLFRNSDLPETEFPPEHFGLTKHSVPMAKIESTDAFLQSAFEFNLTMSTLGRCTREHEKIAYDKSIDCPEAKQLACLLSHLVDGRKGGVHLSQDAWQEYRKKISPRSRAWPAYRETSSKNVNPKRSNIVDYVKFIVAEKHSRSILTEIQRKFPENEAWDAVDDDLARPWREKLKKEWSESQTEEESFTHRAQQLADKAGSLQPPILSTHPLVHTWQNSPKEWRRFLASFAYQRWSSSNFAWLAFGDELCDLKAETMPSRSITNHALSCFKVNRKSVSPLTAADVAANIAESDEFTDDDFKYEGEDVIEALLLSEDVGYFDGLEDGLSIQ
ncbi:RNA-directed RNA polymerase [Penicillium malachiteum]|nr:RNA-directed RNA polymerase [Penicillium malachiteum]